MEDEQEDSFAGQEPAVTQAPPSDPQIQMETTALWKEGSTPKKVLLLWCPPRKQIQTFRIEFQTDDSIQDSNHMDSSYSRGINHKTSPAYGLDVRLPLLCLLAGEITTTPQSLALLAANATKI